MSAITAIYEKGVFRPIDKVALAEGTLVRLEVQENAPAVRDLVPPGTPEAQIRIYEVMARRFHSGRHDLAERHNEHQP
jgi:predicted DNA-binding antitoxin AbrB/MazE fold protein